MKTTIIILILTVSFAFTTQWQPPTVINYTGLTPSFTYDNLKMYVDVVDGFPTSNNIGYNTWNGSAWVWGADVGGDVNTVQYIEKEPFIAYDNQTLYFVREQIGGGWTQVYKATRQGTSETFTGSIALGNQINYINNVQYANYPSLTQDQQKLYFVAINNGYGKIYEATWNGSDWDNVTLLPNEVNEGDSTHQNRLHVFIKPDGS
jgi:hypothetical protein